MPGSGYSIIYWVNSNQEKMIMSIKKYTNLKENNQNIKAVFSMTIDIPHTIKQIHGIRYR